MRFFVEELQGEFEYPDTREELLETIKAESTNGDGKQRACAYFKNYFSNGGLNKHPLLGDLDALRKELQANWDFILHGVNSVAAIIENGLDNLQQSFLLAAGNK